MKPMLAHSYSTHSRFIKWPAIVQPKLDGVRCIYINGKFISRNGKPISGVPRLLEEVRSVIKGSMILDGELYSEELTFQQIVSCVRRSTCISEDPRIQYWIFDTINNSKCAHRMDDICRIKQTDRIKTVHFSVINENFLEYSYDRARKKGFEGVIIRNPDGLYEFKRSKNLIKLKPDKLAEAICTHVLTGLGRCMDTTGAIECVYSGQTFRIGSGLTDVQRDEIFQNAESYVGKKLTFKYQSLTDSGVPRFPVFVEWRDYE